MVTRDEITDLTRAIAMVALPVGTILAVRPRLRLPPRRTRAVPWDGPGVVIAFLVLIVLPDAITTAVAAPNFRDRMIVSAALLPAQIAGLYAAFRLAYGGTEPHYGLNSSRVADDIAVAAVAWFVVVPAVQIVNVAVTAINGSEDVHPLIDAVRSSDSLVTWAVFWIKACVCAPVIEEVFFRGVLQRWLAARPWGGALALIFAVACGAIAVTANVPVSTRTGILVFLAIGVLAFDPLSRRLAPIMTGAVPDARLRSARSLVGTAVLFGAVHTNVWPTPVPLVLLGLALGWLAHRTQGLLAPVLLHAGFNAVACVNAAIGR